MTLQPLTFQISGHQFALFTGPVVYVWYHEEQCRYVGMSRRGLSRILGGKNHHQHIRDIESSDRFDLYCCPTVDEAIRLETALIIELKPELNRRQTATSRKTLARARRLGLLPPIIKAGGVPPPELRAARRVERKRRRQGS